MNSIMDNKHMLDNKRECNANHGFYVFQNDKIKAWHQKEKINRITIQILL